MNQTTQIKFTILAVLMFEIFGLVSFLNKTCDYFRESYINSDRMSLGGNEL